MATENVSSGYVKTIASPAAKRELPIARRKVQPTIVEEVATFIRRFVFFRDDVLYDLIAVWIIATHLSDLFEYTGYIFAHSPEPQSGKTRLLDVLDLLVHGSSGVLVSPTEAVLFRTASGGTQLLDEVDSWGNGETLRSILNAGFQRNGKVVRLHGENGNFQPERHRVYAPRALAGIGTRILNVATRDRTFMLEMVRQTKGERREQWRVRKIEPDATALKGKIAGWSLTNQKFVEAAYDAEDAFPYLENFRDRTVDITQSIAAIVEVAYADSPQLKAAQARLIEAIVITRAEERSPKDQHKVIQQLLLIADSDPLIGSASELSGMCANLADPPSQELVSSVLRLYGFKTKNVRKDGGQPRLRYSLPKAKLVEILERYGAVDPCEAAPVV